MYLSKINQSRVENIQDLAHLARSEGLKVPENSEKKIYKYFKDNVRVRYSMWS